MKKGRGLYGRGAFLVSYCKIDTINFSVNFPYMKNDKKVNVSFSGRHISNACNVSVRFVDLETSEVLYDGHKNVVFSCGLNDSEYIQSVVDSLVRGLQSGRSVYVEIKAERVRPDGLVPYIFHNIPSAF